MGGQRLLLILLFSLWAYAASAPARAAEARVPGESNACPAASVPQYTSPVALAPAPHCQAGDANEPSGQLPAIVALCDALCGRGLDFLGDENRRTWIRDTRLPSRFADLIAWAAAPRRPRPPNARDLSSRMSEGYAAIASRIMALKRRLSQIDAEEKQASRDREALWRKPAWASRTPDGFALLKASDAYVTLVSRLQLERLRGREELKNATEFQETAAASFRTLGVTDPKAPGSVTSIATLLDEGDAPGSRVVQQLKLGTTELTLNYRVRAEAAAVGSPGVATFALESVEFKSPVEPGAWALACDAQGSVAHSRAPRTPTFPGPLRSFSVSGEPTAFATLLQTGTAAEIREVIARRIHDTIARRPPTSVAEASELANLILTATLPDLSAGAGRLDVARAQVDSVTLGMILADELPYQVNHQLLESLYGASSSAALPSAESRAAYLRDETFLTLQTRNLNEAGYRAVADQKFPDWDDRDPPPPNNFSDRD